MQETDFYRDLGLKLKAYRRQRKMTIEMVSGRLNKSTATISKYENGEIAIGLDVLYDYCMLLNVDMSMLLPSSVAADHRDGERYSNDFIDFLWVYWYRYNEKKLFIGAIECDNHTMQSTFFHGIHDYRDIHDCDFIYCGVTTYSDHNVDFFFHNIGVPHDSIALRLPNLVKQKDYRIGMMLSTDFSYRNIAIKCLTCKKPIMNQDFLLEKLKISTREIKYLRETNFFMTDTE